MLAGAAQQERETIPSALLRRIADVTAGTPRAGDARVGSALPAVPQASAPTRNTKAPVRIRIGKDTTYVLGPVDQDGNIDYVGGVLERNSRGVRRDNAAIQFWPAAGPWEIPIKSAVSFSGLGISPPPLQGDYFPG